MDKNLGRTQKTFHLISSYLPTHLLTYSPRAFTLAEVVVVMGILTVMMAAFAPVLTKKTINPSGDKRITFDIMPTHTGIYYGSQADTKSVVIGDNKLESGIAFSPKLLIVSNNEKDSTKASPHIAFASKIGDNALKYTGQLLMDPTSTGTSTDTKGNLILGGIYNTNYPVKSDLFYGNTIIGMNAGPTSENNNSMTVVGAGTTVSGNGSTALGYGAQAKDGVATALGYMAKATNSSVAVGRLASTSNTGATALGYSANASGDSSIAAGWNAKSSGQYSAALGPSASANTNAVAVGYRASASPYSVAIGDGASASSYMTVVGKGACRYSSESYSVCLGADSGPTSMDSNRGIWIGRNTYLYDASKIHFGNQTLSSIITTATSDRRLKNVGKEYVGGLDELNKLKFYNYTLKDDQEKTPQVGVIAQDLRKVLPNAVFKDSDGYLKVRRDHLFFAALNAIKTLFNRITELEKRNAELEKRLEKLESLLVK